MGQSMNHLHRYEVVDGCWEYTGPLNSEGYPNTGANRTGHRLSYEHHIGPIPEGLMVCHSCGNRKCINPAHLYAGTAKQNYYDRYKHGSKVGMQGDENPKAKITADTARTIRNSTMPLREAAEVFGVSVSTISSIRTGRTWGHL